MPIFLIDARSLLRKTTETFWGAPLIIVNGRDNTFCYGFMRDLLRLRNLLHVNAGGLAFGRDAWSLAPKDNVRTVVQLCRDIGVMVIEGPGALAIGAAHAEHFTDIVTDDKRFLCLCSAKRTIHLARQTGSIEPMTPAEVYRRMGVPPHCIPTYLALTEAGKYTQTTNDTKATLTGREAKRLVETHGTLSVIYQRLSAIKSSILRKKLADNQKSFEQRYQDNTATPSTMPARLPPGCCSTNGKLVKDRSQSHPPSQRCWFSRRLMVDCEVRGSLASATALGPQAPSRNVNLVL